MGIYSPLCVLNSEINPTEFQSLSWWNGDLQLPAQSMENCWNLFQSLSWWNGDLQMQAAFWKRAEARVSILVMVEWGFTVEGNRNKLLRHAGFNPCHGGMGIYRTRR